MALTSGTRLGPYEILAPLGAGGMGVVYKARDTRLGREVAIKVLPAEVASDPSRLKRFEKEARSASALNHPNIVTIYDIGTTDSVSWIAMERVEGKTLRELLFAGALPIKRLLPIATQIADGLARAHEAGIVHRDLKPENVMVTKDGLVKILDFGLAKLTQASPGSDEGSQMPTETGTSPGVVLGTVGYMSPEQVRGESADASSDIFSFGAVLYEMLTAKRAFRGDSAVETMNAILREDPPELSELKRHVSPVLVRVLLRCLEKRPRERFESAHDLAYFLRAISDLPESELQALPPGRSQSRTDERVASAAMPLFQRLTFGRGMIFYAQFAPDAQTIVYGAAWNGNPFQLFSTRLEGPESGPLPLPDACVLSVSSTGEMAVLLDFQFLGPLSFRGTLARAPLIGGAPREVLEGVSWADWSPDGSRLLVVRRIAGKSRLEYPIGKVLYETSGAITRPRLSPDGNRIAFIEHLDVQEAYFFKGSIAILDENGSRRTLSSGWNTAWGLAWSSDGSEVWFTASKRAEAAALHAVSLSGTERLVYRAPGQVRLHDISRDGRVLLTSDNARVGILALPPDESRERDLSLFHASSVSDLSSDGKTLLFNELHVGVAARAGVYVRRTDGSPAVRLGDGVAICFSPDENWVLAMSEGPPRGFSLLPVGAGEPRPLALEGIEPYWAGWFPDQERLLIAGSESGRGMRLYVLRIEGGKPEPVTPEGMAGAFSLSPDGQFVVVRSSGRAACVVPIGGGEPQSVPGLDRTDRPIRWAADGRSLYIFRRGELPCTVFRLDMTTGLRSPWRKLAPPDPAGLATIPTVRLNRDGKAYAYTYLHILSDLYVVSGLK